MSLRERKDNRNNFTTEKNLDVNPSKQKLLSDDEYSELFDSIRKGDEALRQKNQKGGSDPNCDLLIEKGILAREEILLANKGYCYQWALFYRNYGVPEEDLVQEGYIGLNKAIDQYEPSEGRFSTYAYQKVRKAVQTAAYSQGSREHNNNTQERLRKLIKCQDVFEKKHGRKPSLEELHDITGFRISTIKVLLLKKDAPLSLEEIFEKDEKEEEPISDDGYEYMMGKGKHKKLKRPTEKEGDKNIVRLEKERLMVKLLESGRVNQTQVKIVKLLEQGYEYKEIGEILGINNVDARNRFLAFVRHIKRDFKEWVEDQKAENE